MADFVDEHMDAIRNLSVEALVGTGWAKNSKQAWLAYFWAEARNEINRAKFYAYREWYLDCLRDYPLSHLEWTRPTRSAKHTMSRSPTRSSVGMPGFTRT